jgi:hypothetical protein
MRTLREWIHRLFGSVHSGRRDDDLEQELRLHLELAAENAGRDHPDDAVLRLARIQAGGVSQTMDVLRDQRGLPWLENLVRDVRHGMRALRRATRSPHEPRAVSRHRAPPARSSHLPR